MGISFETMIPPSKLKMCPDVRLQKPPIVNTSIWQLADAGYCLYVNAKYFPVYHRSKVSMLFRGHDGFAGLNYVMWEECKFASDQDVLAWISTLSDFDVLEPNNLRKKDTRFFKMPDPVVVEKVVEKPVPSVGPLDSMFVIVDRDGPIMRLGARSDSSDYYLFNAEDEAEMVRALNDVRAERIKVLRAPVSPETMVAHEERRPTNDNLALPIMEELEALNLVKSL